MRGRLGVALLCVVGCAPGQAIGQGRPPAVNTRLTDVRAGGATLRLARRLELPGRADSTVFSDIWDIAIDSERRVWVVDPSVPRILVFDSSGRRVAAIGRRGDGPGEFRQPVRIAVGPGDTVVVYDMGTSRFTFLTPTAQFARSVTASRRLGATDLQQHPSGVLVIAALDRESLRTLHIFDQASGRLIRSFRAVPEPSTAFRGFEEALFSGQLDITPSGQLLYSQFSPYAVELFDISGTKLSGCEDPDAGLSDPAATIRAIPGGVRLDWNRFIRSGGVFALSDTLFLNVVTDPVNDRRQFDVLTRSCLLLSRRILDIPILLTKRDPSRRFLGGAVNTGRPEIVVYEVAPLR